MKNILIFAQSADEPIARDQRFKLYASGKLSDVEADPLEKDDLAASNDSVVAEARQRLQKVPASLPPDGDVAFVFRSSSAFRINTGGKKDKKKE